jgi:glycerophosphoryl diester phosphodiesterase
MAWIGIGHRGAPREFPGNTMSGFARAVEYGCHMVECDVRQAADGVLVLAHDPHVTDVGGKTYEIAAEMAETLAQIDLGAGEGVPTLEELVEFASGRCAIMADMKCEDDGVEARVVAALARLRVDAKIVPGAGEESRQRFRALDATLPLSLSLGRGTELLASPAGFETLLPTIDTDAVTWEYPLLSAERIAALHVRGLRVFAWTVDDPAVMERLIADGVDGVISNRPDLLMPLQRRD